MADQKLTDLTEVSVPALDDLLYLVDVSDTSGGAAGTSKKVSRTRELGTLNQVCEGRLTLTSGTPVTTTDVTAATSVYFTPFNGNQVALYDGTRWRMYAFTELTLALGMLTSGKNYDVFLYDNAGTLTLESLAWTSDTARATALVFQDGVYCKTGALTRRYLGTFRTISTTQTADSGGGTSNQVGGKRFLWNMYNRQPRPINVVDTADTWTYGTASFRVANGATAPLNCVEFLCGLPEVEVQANLAASGYFATNTHWTTALGLDGTSISGRTSSVYTNNTSLANVSAYRAYPGAGYHYLAWLEKSTDSVSVTFAGDDAGNASNGITATIWG